MTALTTLRIARPAVAAFAAMGVLWGGFAADLPDIKTMLNIDEAYLGALMFMTPIAAVAAMLMAPSAGAAFGRVALPVSCLLMSLGFVLPGQFSTLWLFALAMMVCGAGTGLTDILMNARVSALEVAGGRPLMNLCHAAYSFGYAAGAIGTGALRSAGWSPAWVFCSMALVAGLLSLLSYERDGRIDGLSRPKGAAAARLGWVPVIGGAMVLIAFLTENAAENWSALHIEKSLGGSPAAGAMGPAMMAITMGVARLFGQGLAARVPAVWLLTAGAVVSAIGALTAAMAWTPAVAYAGFIVMGVGSSVIAPTTFSLIGQMAAPEARARAVARATLLGYFGYFFGPPLIGAIAGEFGLRFAFVFAAGILAGVPILARMLRD
jgi:hypothetical protein